MDLGFLGGFEYKKETVRRLPFEILAAYDIDNSCAETYKANIGPHFHRIDLAMARTTRMPKADVLIGGFPCQEFSICGPRKGLSSKRGKLYRVLVKYASKRKPKVIVAENVSHITRLNGGKDFAKILGDFDQVGYRMHVWNVRAPDHGVPQERNRVFLVGVRKDLPGKPVCPKASFTTRHRSIEWAIGDLAKDPRTSVPNQNEFFLAARAKTGHGQGDEISKRNAPGYTVRANAKSRVQFHYELSRRLTIRECARLQTFPDTFKFIHAPTTSISQIGNAVPPLLAHRIARSVAKFLSSQKQDRNPRSRRGKNK
jgi:DNA (cytosine-5)-methyltransferase 1